MSRCYICLESSAPLIACTHVPCAWAWHAHCQRQRDLVPGPGDGQWVAITCESGHLQTAGGTGPTQKRVRKEWRQWAYRWRGHGLGGILWAAGATFCLWFVAILWTLMRLWLVDGLVRQGIVILCLVFRPTPTCGTGGLASWGHLFYMWVRITIYWSVAVACINFVARLFACWPLRTVDYK